MIEHTDACPPGMVGDWLVEAGLRLDRVLCHRGESLPPDLAGHAAVVVMGGEMGADDDADHPWLAPTKALLRTAVETAVPTLGICLGHQLLAVACGGSIAKAADGQQVGLFPIQRTEAGRTDPLFADLLGDARAVHWNGDVVSNAPDGAQVLSTTTAGLQAFRLGSSAWGVQFHPEVRAGDVRPWAANDVSHGRLKAGRVDEAVAAIEAAEPSLAAALRPLTHRFAALVG